jgi:hypothetical protein
VKFQASHKTSYLEKVGGEEMAKDDSTQGKILKASKQLAMLTTLYMNGLLKEQDYEKVRESIYRDYPIIAGINSK